MRKRIFIHVLAIVILASVYVAEAQQAGKVYRIAILRFPPGACTTSSLCIGVRQGLRELGYVEGQNLVIEYRSAEGKRERLPDLFAELVRLKVDVIVPSPAPPAIRAAQRATRTIPIVMAGVHVDPVEAGFVVSLARPGGNITGVAHLDARLHAKRLEQLKEAFPRISRVAILWSRGQQKQAMKEVEAVGEALGIQIHRVVGGPLDDLESVFSAISRGAPDALLVASMPLTIHNRAQVVELTAKRGLPTIYTQSGFVDAGGLMSYGVKVSDLFRRTATYVDKILKGAKPGDLPVEQPTKFELIINLKTAKKLGLTIPPQFLARAKRVIK